MTNGQEILVARDLVEELAAHGLRNNEIAVLLNMAKSSVHYIRQQLKLVDGHTPNQKQTVERVARLITNKDLLRRAREFRERMPKQSRHRPTVTQTETYMANAKKPAKKPAAKKTTKKK